MLNLNCVICAELFSHSDDVHVTHCGHMFHFVCLKQWMERSKSCPQCRNKCTDRNIFRVYFNLANLDVSHIDVGSLQEQLDNANLQIKIKEKDLRKTEEQIDKLKDVQKKCMKTIGGMEMKLAKNDFLILSYTEQLKLLKTDAKLVNDLRSEVRTLKQQIDAMESVSTILCASNAEADRLLKIEGDPKKLSVWVSTLKRELRLCESKKTDMRNVLKVVQSDLRKEIEIKKLHEERISQLESENYQLNEKIKTLETAKTTTESFACTNNKINDSNNALLKAFEERPSNQAMRAKKRSTISPTIKDNIRKIEESNSPYLNIKSSSIGLVPLFKTNSQTGSDITSKTTTKLATLKISPLKSNSAAGALRKTNSTEKYSIFKRPRIGVVAATASANTAGLMKPLAPNFVFNGYGGSEKVDPFAHNSDEELLDEPEVVNTSPTKTLKQQQSNVKATQLKRIPSAGTLSLSNRVKSGNLRNIKLSK